MDTVTTWVFVAVIIVLSLMIRNLLDRVKALEDSKA